jgi:hypothetical protein
MDNKLSQKGAKQYYCETCDYECFKKSNWIRHLTTDKHKLIINDNKKNIEGASNFYCESCNYECCKKSNWYRHLTTDKHKKSQKEQKVAKKEQKNECQESNHYKCDNCNKSFSYLSNLSRHKKICENNNINKNNFFDILQQNQEFKELILEQNKQIFEQNKQIIELSSKVGTNISNNNVNSNNKTFNLQVFLNEKCKDALNITDFVNSLKLTLEDLENVGENGFVSGITKIFINGLKKLDVYKRPIHCSDLKRETMYLKNENVWEKDDENKEQMKKVIKQIANKNINKIYEWKDKYPDCKYSDSKKNDQYLKILLESFGSKTKEEDQLLYEKIIKNIAKETMIDKNK